MTADLDVSTPSILWLGDTDSRDASRVGAKAANLSAYFDRHDVPPGFVVPALPASWRTIPDGLSIEISDAYDALATRCGTEQPSVAVRSSALDEDGAGSSFAGQHATFLNVSGKAAVLDAVLRCLNSALSDEAAAYRRQNDLPLDDIRIAVLVQQLVPADVSAVVFSCNPVNGSLHEVMINANWGLGESIVGGTATPDTFIVDKDSADILEQVIARKTHRTVRDKSGTCEEKVEARLQTSPSLTDAEVRALTQLAISLEQSAGHPVDLECAIANGKIFLLQCRPVTTL